MKMLFCSLFIVSAAFAGEFKAQTLKANLALLEATCGKKIRLNGSQQLDILDTVCVSSHGEYCFQFGVNAYFTDGSLGSVGWNGSSVNGRSKARCNFNQ